MIKKSVHGSISENHNPQVRKEDKVSNDELIILSGAELKQIINEITLKTMKEFILKQEFAKQKSDL